MKGVASPSRARTRAALFVAMILASLATPGTRSAVAAPCTAMAIDTAVATYKDKIDAIAKEFPDAAGQPRAFELFIEAVRREPELGERLHPDIVGEILANPEGRFLANGLTEVLGSLQASPGGSDREKVDLALRALLEKGDRVPLDTVEQRIKDLETGSPEAVRRALGDLTHPEALRLVYGADHLHPSPESLIGKYIAETGATTMERAFPVTLGSAQLGPTKLVVSISAESFPVFQRLFSRHEFFSVLGHADIFHSGIYHTYGGKQSPFTLPGTQHKVLPMVVLKTTEGQRMTQFLKLDAKYTSQRSWTNEAQQPWLLPGYTAKSAYGTCTQKIGSMPIGDKLVDSYTFPGAMDTYGEGWATRGGVPEAPRVGPLKPYDHPDPMIKRVWTVPGHEQFAYTLGLGGAHERSELANPGWVILNLLGPAAAERVPFIFVVNPQHRTPITPDFVPGYERPL